ncbi:ABC transporter permease [Dethiothermospora halolimnae]|uniref:ABC transporter permease n=1 Tax=Dethiothermospora halolimnae TaxID=3114390 RepID=UPI003CCC414F
MKLLKYIGHDLKEIIGDRDVIIIMLLGPIFLTFLFGGVYINDYLDDIPIAIMDMDNSSMSRMIIDNFDNNDRFIVKYYPSTTEELKKVINDRKAHMAVYIPKDFSQDVKGLRGSEVAILVDGTNIVIGNNAYSKATSIIQTVSAGTQIKLIQSKGQLPEIAEKTVVPFNFTDRILYDPKITYMNYLLFGFIAVFLQQVTFSGVGISICKNGNKMAVENPILRIFSRIIASGIYCLISTFIAILIAIKVFEVPFNGSIPLALGLSTIFVLAISPMAIIIASFVKKKLKFVQIAYMLSLPTFATCGYVWTTEHIPNMLVIGSKILWPLVYFARPFDEILFKGADFSVIKSDFYGLIIFAVIWLTIAIWLFKVRFKVNSKQSS